VEDRKLTSWPKTTVGLLAIGLVAALLVVLSAREVSGADARSPIGGIGAVAFAGQLVLGATLGLVYALIRRRRRAG
jgi:hypothetical protein